MSIIDWKPATAGRLAGLGLLGLALAAWPACAAQPTVQPPASAPARSTAPAPAAAPGAQGPQGAQTQQGGQTPRVGERRRRNSYASCNRTSNQRGLRGGARRRFLIRCRLGYERKNQNQGAPAQTQQPAPQAPAAQPPARRP
ncbi:hypothetical protein [Methylobacterium segetis]|uniref:hypothetical protein n=1 Tax=Methylobacterium segetis TaxID=2488750 RepID=UPI001FE21D2D|nr:hypothetical protein [Methylobacterium segetis]